MNGSAGGVPTQRSAGTPRTGLWIGASVALRRPAPTCEPYPHTCGTSLTGLMTGRPVRLGNRDCAACAAPTIGPPCAAGCGWPVDPAAAAGGHDRHPGCGWPMARPALRVIKGGRAA